MTVAGFEPPRCAGTSKRRNSRRRTPACDMEPCFSLPQQLSVNTGTIRKQPQQWWQTVGQDSGREEHVVDPATGDRIRGHLRERLHRLNHRFQRFVYVASSHGIHAIKPES